MLSFPFRHFAKVRCGANDRWGLLGRGREQVALPTWSGSRDAEQRGSCFIDNFWEALLSRRSLMFGASWDGERMTWIANYRGGGGLTSMIIFPPPPQAAWRVMGYLKRPKLFSTLVSIFPVLWTEKSFAAPGKIHLLLLSPPTSFYIFCFEWDC